MILFKGAHFPKDVILFAVFFYVRYGVSYRDIEEIMAERGVDLDHVTLNCWVVKYAPLTADKARARNRATARSWRVDETYIKVKGRWMLLYRALDKHGETLDFMLSQLRVFTAAWRFIHQTIQANGVPEKVMIDRSDTNLAGLQAMNIALKAREHGPLIRILQCKYLNNIIEQDHRLIKRLTHPMLGFKAVHSAAATLTGIEVPHMIRKAQFASNERSPFKLFAQLAA